MEPKLEWLMDYEVNISKRYRRMMSVVLVEPGEKAKQSVTGVLKSSFRDCDALLQVNGYMAIIMSETGKDGGLRAIERARHKLGKDDTAFSLVTFPFDGNLSYALLERAKERLIRARRGEAAGVVYEEQAETV